MRKELRRELCRTFGHEMWTELREYLVEATKPYPVKFSWKCIAKGRSKKGSHCIVTEQGNEDPNTNGWYTTEFFTYIRFKGCDNIFRYKNPIELVNHIRYFDETLMTELEEGDEFILEPPGLARSHEYSNERRKAIKDGTWIVKPRGPNPNMRRTTVHHFRPF